MTGYLLTPRGNDVPDDGSDGVRTRQAILNYQTDKPLDIDSIVGNQTRNGLIADAGA
jgi:peptidoglycan hydrolase-like protein with peptidoglycan-binding domain